MVLFTAASRARSFPVGRKWRRVSAVWALASMSMIPAMRPAEPARDPGDGMESDVVRAIDQAQTDREARLAGYTVTEHYAVRNARFSEAAEMTVATEYARGSGKSFRVLSRTGPSVLQSLVLDRVLAGETEMSRGDTRQSTLIVSKNYRMKLLGRERLGPRLCDVVEISPRTAGLNRLAGKAWVDAASHHLVRIQGRAVKGVSFLSGRPWIVRDYDDFDGFSLAVRSHATSESFLLGRTDLNIEYSDYHTTVR